MYELKWTNGQPYERSRRRKTYDVDDKKVIAEDNKIIEGMPNNAYNSALNYDENTWDILNQTNTSGVNDNKTKGGQREELDNKIANRELIQQRGINPFLEKNDYVNDIIVSNEYLQPVSSNRC